MRVQRDKSRRLLGFSRQMRHGATDAEGKLWNILRSRSLAGYKFRRQYAIGGYILDFYYVKFQLAIELDGGQHNEFAAIEYDRRRESMLKELGVRMVRFWDDEVLKYGDSVAEAILKYLESPHPDPLPEYREREKKTGGDREH